MSISKYNSKGYYDPTTYGKTAGVIKYSPLF